MFKSLLLIFLTLFSPASQAKSQEYGIATGSAILTMNQNELDQYFTALSNLGVGWIRWDMDWSSIQPNNPDTYDWTAPDRIVAEAQKYNIKSVGIITYSPDWEGKPVNPADFSVFAATVANRYKNSVNTWEIWNEPNLSKLWGTTPNVNDYANLLKAAYPAIKNANPDAIVISGGLASEQNQIAFVTGLYALGANHYFDALALHPYGGLPAVATVRNIMDTNGDNAKKIWITEYGAATDGPKGSSFIGETTQKLMAMAAIKFYNQNASRMGPFFWYSLRDNGTTNDTVENFFGLLRFDWSQKPAYLVIQNAIKLNK
jgi:hypothetical protein